MKKKGKGTENKSKEDTEWSSVGSLFIGAEGSRARVEDLPTVVDVVGVDVSAQGRSLVLHTLRCAVVLCGDERLSQYSSDLGYLK